MIHHSCCFNPSLRFYVQVEVVVLLGFGPSGSDQNCGWTEMEAGRIWVDWMWFDWIRADWIRGDWSLDNHLPWSGADCSWQSLRALLASFHLSIATQNFFACQLPPTTFQLQPTTTFHPEPSLRCCIFTKDQNITFAPCKNQPLVAGQHFILQDIFKKFSKNIWKLVNILDRQSIEQPALHSRLTQFFGPDQPKWPFLGPKMQFVDLKSR